MFRYDKRVVILLCKKRTDNSTITVPVPNHKEIKLGTLLSIIRQSGVPKNVV
ncbi:type II toxin-antitoxin system HicA family toxin [Ohtaekwangia kribbensis]|uniref:Type II toxin-antitoxin system HicA family toxin n=1 Tax=Ohtaekwangia kribbensis TaxID=688913 RepID=A0ABW3K959_9BACT